MDNLIGKKLKSDVINTYGVTIIPAHTVINSDSIRLLLSHKIDINSLFLTAEVEINDPYPLVQQVVAKSKLLFESIIESRKVPLLEIRNEVIPSIQDISNNENLFELFEAIKAKDDYTYQHNIGVGVLSTLIGRWMNLSESELSILSLGAVLHDIGKVKIPKEILNKPGKLTKEEFDLMKKHTIFGYEMLKETTGLNQRIAFIALQHHERDDGKGYPLGLVKGKIDMLSSIVAVADIFHAMSSKRPYHDPIPFYEIVNQMRQEKFGQLNPHIVSIFLENIMKRLIGERVMLTDGQMGEVVYLNPHSVEKPLILIDETFYDLSKEKDLQIQSIVVL